jgi:hypothetical protein
MPTTIIWEGIAGLVLCLSMALLAIYFYGRNQRDIGYEEGRADRRTAQLAEQTADRAVRAGRHRQGQPRASAPSPPAAVPPDPMPARTALVRDREPWYTPVGGPVELPRGGAIGIYLEKTAASIDTVLLPPEPAPGLNGAADTGTMPRVQLDLASTGELRAITSAWIAEHCPGAEEAEAIA